MTLAVVAIIAAILLEALWVVAVAAAVVLGMAFVGWYLWGEYLG